VAGLLTEPPWLGQETGHSERFPEELRRYAGGINALAIGAEDHAEDHVRVIGIGSNFLPRLQVPHLSRLVPTSAGQPLTIRAEGQAPDHVAVRRQGQFHLAGAGITDQHDTVNPACGHAPAVPAEDDAGKAGRSRVWEQGERQQARRRSPS